MTTAELTVVVNADSMDEPTFLKHLYARHEDRLAGLRVDSFASDYIEECYRTYHDSIHRLVLQENMDHEHGA